MRCFPSIFLAKYVLAFEKKLSKEKPNIEHLNNKFQANDTFIELLSSLFHFNG